MRNFVQEISGYARSIKPGFIVIPQNGQELLARGEAGAEGTDPDWTYLQSIDGVGREDLFYGWNNDNEATPASECDPLIPYLEMARSNGKRVLVTDYCSSQDKMNDSYAQNNAKGYISFAADHRELDDVPAFPPQPYNASADTIAALAQAKNFLYIINPGTFTSRAGFINAVKATPYDLVLMDLYFNDGSSFTPAEIAQLKMKPGGAPRLLICYMSIGEAEDYRYYWQSFWKGNPPSFLDAEDMDWPGNYKVKYWDKSWQSIIFGNDNSYTKKILDAGFDGVYLDIIDGFEYFEDINRL